MPDIDVKKATASFHTQGRLLQELGERLVARADVALMELIKNAYDADASECRVAFDGDSVVIEDNGHGMSEDEFLDKWMQIATPDKERERKSRKYKRTVTGSKGIGRFAVRFLGRYLHLETIAAAKGKGAATQLSVDFKWEQIDKASQLHTVKIPYEVRSAPPDAKPGTRLIITQLRNPDTLDFKTIRTQLLLLINPYSGLKRGWFAKETSGNRDPGFKAILPGPAGDTEEELASTVLKNAYARVSICHKNNVTKYTIRNRDGEVLLERTHPGKSHISRGVYADIRYFPRRAGMFQNVGVDGRMAWSWVRQHWGVGVVDHGFRIRPYGFEDDDWLRLSWDSAQNRRDWRVAFMNELFPMPAEASSQPKLNPMLYLPNLHQLVGAVFVESSQSPGSRRPTDLTPSMDREGFVENEAYQELVDIVRAGLEMLAYADHREQRRLEEEKKKKEAKALRSDLRKAADYIRVVPGLSSSDRDNLATHFTSLSKELERVEEYYQVTTSKLELMGLLGVLAGFVTHEMQRVLNGLDRLLAKARKAFGKNEEVSEVIEQIEQAHAAMVGQLDYATAFVGAVHESRTPELIKARGAVRLVVKQFDSFIAERHIDVDVQIEEGVHSPALPRALYAGVVMNLFTNALKAVIGGIQAADDPRVSIKAWNEPKWHVVEVADTGVGIPPDLRKRIWDPLFTTTSGQEYNPLGSGMGLGLSLVKTVVTEAKGRVDLVDPPPGFNTCFRVQFPR